MEIGLSLGSNVGDRRGCLQRARTALAATRGLNLVACAPLYETEPVDMRAEAADMPFLNTVIIMETTRSAQDVAARAHAIEAAMGRTRTGERHAPRCIDIDLIYADDLVSEFPTLILPHPRWSERRFVVEPLAAVRPSRILPGQERSVEQVLLSLSLTPRVVVFEHEW